MAPIIYALALPALLATAAEVVEASAPSSGASAPWLQPVTMMCPSQHPHPPSTTIADNQHQRCNPIASNPTIDESNIELDSSTTHDAFKVRGGGIWGNHKKSSRDPLSSEPSEGDDDEEEEGYEYEYEYYEVDDDESIAAAPEENEVVEEDVGDGFEYEYYEEEEDSTSLYYKFGKVQDIDGEFMDASEEEEEEALAAFDGEDDEGVATAGLEGKADDTGKGSGWSLWGLGRQGINGGAAAHGEEDFNDEALDGGDGDIADEDDDEDSLLSTPLPAMKNRMRSFMPKVQLANRTVPKPDLDIEDTDEEEYAEEEEEEYEEEPYYDDESYEDDNLLETPLAKSQPTANARKAPRASRADGTSRWWQHQPKKSTKKRRRRSKMSQWRPMASAKASFVSPLFYSGGAPRSFSLRSYDGRPFYSAWFSSFVNAISAIVQPIGNVIQTMTFSVVSALSRCISMTFGLVRNWFDFLWYGPVDGVTTTGIPNRGGGVSALLFSSPVAIAVSSVVVLGLAAVLVRKLWYESVLLGDHDTRRKFENFDDEEFTDDDTMGPPSVEEELEFLNRQFDPANPSSKERIAEAIVKQNRFGWPSLRRNGDRPKSQREQRKFTIKSIQTWWKERPLSRSMAIIEPQHLRNQQQPLGQEIKRLQKQLTVSEQERALLQQDVQRLQHKLSKAQHDARSIIQQNKWLEQQTSRADQILTKAVEVERRKANEEMGRIRESMKGVLERERMLMRGRFATTGSSPLEQRKDAIGVGRNDLDLNKSTPKRILDGLDGVKIVRERDHDDGQSIEGERAWTAM